VERQGASVLSAGANPMPLADDGRVQRDLQSRRASAVPTQS
jgi:hypothetical protein